MCNFYQNRNTLLGFIELMSRTCGYDHVQHILSSVKFLHEFFGHSYAGDSIEFKVLLRGLRRKLAKPTRQVLPITPEILILMYEHIDLNNTADLAHWSSFLFALRLLYRKSSIAPELIKKFNSEARPCPHDFVCGRPGSMAPLCVSKVWRARCSANKKQNTHYGEIRFSPI